MGLSLRKCFVSRLLADGSTHSGPVAIASGSAIILRHFRTLPDRELTFLIVNEELGRPAFSDHVSFYIGHSRVLCVPF